MKKLMMFFVLAINLIASAAYENVTTNNYPDADSVLVDGYEETTYNPDGTYVTIGEQWTKVLTEKGRREEREFELSYNARYGRAEILSVAIISPNGEEHSIDVKANSKEATDNSSASANIYDPQDRRIVCTIPKLNIGDVIHIKTRNVATKARVENQFADIAIFSWTHPILKYSVRINAPEKLPLANVAVRHPINNVSYEKTVKNDGSILHTWVATNSPQVFPEPDMPPLYTQVQHLRVSTVKDWRDISKWYWNLSVPHLEKTTLAMTNKVEEIGRDISKIYKWVAQEIRYMGLTLEDVSPGYAPHDVNITFDNRYGVCRDKAGLLVAMLRIAGFDAFPVLIHAGAKMDAEVPLPYFNHAIVAVRDAKDSRANKDGYILMDPTDESSRDLFPSYLSDKSYLVATPEGETLLTSPVPVASNNAVKIASSGNLASDGSLVMTTEISFGGINDNAYRRGMLKRRLDDRKKSFESIVQFVAPGAELISFELKPDDLRETESPLTAKFVYRAPEVLLRGETRSELAIPQLSKVLGIANWLLDGSTSLESRKYPLQVSSTAMTDETIDIDLGSSLGEAISLPEEINIAGDYSFSRKFVATNGHLIATRQLAINAVEFSPNAYADLRERVKNIEAAERAKPVFATNDKLANANVRYEQKSYEVYFSSPTSWVATNTIAKEILTYQGKKNSSELKFEFNPTWKNVEVISAKVWRKDGSFIEVGEKEKNIFDCDWAALAPRYPATKELVVNLPGVEIGSKIVYTTVTTVTNAPTPYYGAFYFDSFEPTDEIYYRWGDSPEEERRERKVELLKNESYLPPGALWRDCEIISLGDFATARKNLREVAIVKPLRDNKVFEACVATNAVDKLKNLRDWMYGNVRVAGPSLYEIPLATQITDPATVLKEGYASRLDYVRTLCALAKGLGFDADIIFAANISWGHPDIVHMDLYEKPDIMRFAYPLCRVRIYESSWFGLVSKPTTYYLGTESHYMPFGIATFPDFIAIDPKDEEFLFVAASESEHRDDAIREYQVSIRENGGADIDVRSELYGPSVSVFRKFYSDILPEDRQRHYQELLGELAQAATATSELITDVNSYPARLEFSAFVPKYAVVDQDTISLVLPDIGEKLFSMVGNNRENPVGLSPIKSKTTLVEVTFPEGYTIVESCPKPFVFTNPLDNEQPWFALRTTITRDEKGCLVARIGFFKFNSSETFLPREYFALLKEWSRVSSSRANRTIVVRREKKENKKEEK